MTVNGAIGESKGGVGGTTGTVGLIRLFSGISLFPFQPTASGHITRGRGLAVGARQFARRGTSEHMAVAEGAGSRRFLAQISVFKSRLRPETINKHRTARRKLTSLIRR